LLFDPAIHLSRSLSFSSFTLLFLLLSASLFLTLSFYRSLSYLLVYCPPKEEPLPGEEVEAASLRETAAPWNDKPPGVLLGRGAGVDAAAPPKPKPLLEGVGEGLEDHIVVPAK